MRAVRFNVMLKNRDGTIIAIMDKTCRECCSMIESHLTTEYGLNKSISYSKLNDVFRGKTKNTILNYIIVKIEKRQLNTDEVKQYRDNKIPLC